MCRKKHRLYRRAQRSQNASHRAAFEQLQNKTGDALRKAHWSYVNGILTDGLEEGKFKPFYGYLKSQKQDSQGVSPLRDHGQLHSDAPTKAHILSDQFKSVFTSDEPDPNIRFQGPEFPTISPLVIETPGVEKLMVSLNPRKASGPDEIPARILQVLSFEIAPVLTTIFSQSIQSGNLPNQWKKAWITPVFKKGGRSVPSNYRPVSLTSISCKLLEHIYFTHLWRHIDQHNILGEANHGFRARYSTETQLLTTTHDMLKQRDKGKQLDVVILDFSKAFDTVPHQRLLGKLEHYGVKGNLLRWVEAFLVGRTQTVLVDGVRSREEDVLLGVPQGTVLGPLLFLLYINDLPSHVHADTHCRLFADDCLLYRVADSISDQVQLQRDLRNLERWASDWGMVFNPTCYVMSVSKGHSHQPYFYELCGVVLKSVDHQNYLGVTISRDLNWRAHINKLVTKANQNLGFIRRNLKGSPQELKRLAYIALVHWGIEYASPVWDPHLQKDSDSREKIQRRAEHWITHEHDWKVSVSSLLAQLKLERLAERGRINRLTFIYKILNEHVAVQPSHLDLVLNTNLYGGYRLSRDLFILDVKPLNFVNPFPQRQSLSGTSYQALLHPWLRYHPLEATS